MTVDFSQLAVTSAFIPECNMPRFSGFSKPGFHILVISFLLYNETRSQAVAKIADRTGSQQTSDCC